MASKATTAPAPDLQAERKSLRIHGVIARDLGMSIVTGHYAPGEVLNGEVAASGDLQVSRTAYREALRILAAKGLVESRPKTGTRVSARAKWHLLDPDVLSWIFAVEPEDTLLESLFELRLIVEPQAAGLAAARRTEAHLAQMLAALEGMTEHTLASEAGQLADQHFHAALLDASGNPFLASLASGVGAAVTWTTVFKQRNEPLRRDPLPEHWRVYNAVLAGDADEARRVMAELVDMAFLDTTRALAAKDNQLVPSEA